MMNGGNTFELTVVGVAFFISVGAYLLICRKDGSWVNWSTPGFVISLASGYLFPVASLLLYGAHGSHYAFAYCYATGSLSFLIAALVFAKIRPIRLGPHALRKVPNIGNLPWILLCAGWLLYLPVLIEFKAYLLQPREIYMQTRTGYGVYFFGSTMLGNLGFLLFLFKANKSRFSFILFYLLCAGLMYMHGSKGQLLTLLIIHTFFWIYVRQNKVKLVKAIAAMSIFAAAGIASFALFNSFNDLSEVLLFITGYSDYTTNAMMVIDDPTGIRYYGQLALEGALYSRIPRAIMPSKPKDYGDFKLARTYYPEWYREDTGSPDFGVGLVYADFGSLAIFWFCIQSAFTGYLLTILISNLRTSPTPSAFIVLLYMSGTSMIPAGLGGLPETIVLASTVYVALGWRYMPTGMPRFRRLSPARMTTAVSRLP